MALPWVRLDTQFPSNPKVLELVGDRKYRAAFVYLCGLAYCGAQATDGYVPTAALPFIHGTAREASELVSVGLWVKDRKGWYMPDWAEYQVTSEQAEDVKAKRRVASAKANCKRWHGADCICWRSVG